MRVDARVFVRVYVHMPRERVCVRMYSNDDLSLEAPPRMRQRRIS